MSQVLEIYANGILLDLSPGEVIEKNYQTFNLLNIGTSQGNFTSTFKIPATAKNKTTLGFPGNSPVHNTIPRSLVDCSVNQRGLPIITAGFLVVESADQTDIGCTIYSGSINAIIDFTGEEKIKDLIVPQNPFPIGYDYTWDKDTIFAGRNDQFPIIDWGSNLDELGGDPQTDIRGMSFVVPFRNLIQSIFWLHPNPSLAGRNLVGSAMGDKLFNSLAVAFSGTEDIVSDSSADLLHYFLAENEQDNIQNLSAPSQEPKPIVFTSVIDNPNGRYDLAEGLYTVDPTIGFKGKFRMEIQPQSYRGNQGEIRLWIESSEKGVLLERTVFVLTNKIAKRTILETDEQIFNPGEQITFRFQVDFGDPNAIFQDWLLEETSLVTVLVTPDISGEGDTIIIKDNLPDISQLDLIKEWLTMFGLILLPDPNFDIDPDAPIQIFQFKDLARNFPLAREWSSKIDTRKSISISHHFEQYSQANLVQWREDDQIVTPIGNGVWNVVDEVLGKESIRHISIFAPSIEISQPGASNVLAQIRTFDETFVKVETPEFRLIALTEGSGEAIEWVTGAGPPEPATDYLIGHFLSGIPSGETLSWNNLIEQSYREFSEVLNKGFLLQVNLFLDELDLFSLDFLRPIFLEGQIKDVDLNGYYYLVQVTANREDQSSTPCLLAKIPEQPFTIFLDPDAADYINRMLTHEIAFTEEQTEAINGWINLAKDNGYWDEIWDFYPLLGNNVGGHSEGFKGLAPLSFVNTIPSDHTWGAWKSNGVDSYTEIQESMSIIVGGSGDTGHFYQYVNSDLEAAGNPSVNGGNTSANERLFNRLDIAPDQTEAVMYAQAQSISFLSSSAQGHHLNNRVPIGVRDPQGTLWKGIGSVLALDGGSGGPGLPPALPMFVGAYNNIGTPLGFAPRYYAGISIGTGMTDAQAEAFCVNTHLLNQVFNREATFVLDPDGLIFTTRAATDGFPFTNQQRLIVDNYVKSLKASGAWDNIDHLWPFIGDNIVQHRINLKLPTVSWDLQFVNTIPGDFTVNGWLSNGINSIGLLPLIPVINQKSSLYVTENEDPQPGNDLGARTDSGQSAQETSILIFREVGNAAGHFAHGTASRSFAINVGGTPMISGARFSDVDNRFWFNGIEVGVNNAQRISRPSPNQFVLGAENSGVTVPVLDVEHSAGLKPISVIGQANLIDAIKFDLVNSDTLGFYSAATGLWTTTRTISARIDEAKIAIVIGSAHVTLTASIFIGGEKLQSQVIDSSRFIIFSPIPSRSLVTGNNIHIEIEASQSEAVTQASFYGSARNTMQRAIDPQPSSFPYTSNDDINQNEIRGWAHWAIPFPGNRPGANANRGRFALTEGTYFDDPQPGNASFSSWTVPIGGAGDYRLKANIICAFNAGGVINSQYTSMTITIGRFANATTGGNPLQTFASQTLAPTASRLEFILDSGVINLNEGDIIRITSNQVSTGATPLGNFEVYNTREDLASGVFSYVTVGGSNLQNFDTFGTIAAPGNKPWVIGVPGPRNRVTTVLSGEVSEIMFSPPGAFPGDHVDPQRRINILVEGQYDQVGVNEQFVFIELWAKRFDTPIGFKIAEDSLNNAVFNLSNWALDFQPIYADFVEWIGVRVRVDGAGVTATVTQRSDVFNWFFDISRSSYFSIGRANFDMKLFSIRRNLADTDFASLKISEGVTAPVNFVTRRFGSVAILGEAAAPTDVENEALSTMQNQEALGRNLH